MELLAYWRKQPPVGEVVFSSAKAFGLEWRTMHAVSRRPNIFTPEKGEGQKPVDPAELAAQGIKTFDQLPASMQQLFHDYKHNPEKLRMD